MAITMRADPYTIVIIPGIRGPATYAAGGFNVSVGQLTKVAFAEVTRGYVSGAWAGLAALSAPVTYFVVSGSGNIVTIKAFQMSGEVAAGVSLSHIPFNLKAYGH